MLNAKALAAYIEWPRATLYRHLKNGTFPVRPIPGTKPRRWNRDDVDAWLRGEYVV